MKKILVPILLILMVFTALPVYGAGEFETIRLSQEDIENKLNGNTVSFRMMDTDKSTKKIEIDDAAIKFMLEKGIKFSIEMTNMTLTASPESFKTSDWSKAVKSGEPMGIRLIIKKGDASKVADKFDEWYYNQIGLSRFGTTAWNISGEILVGGVKAYDLTNFAVPVNIKVKYPLNNTTSGVSEKNLEMYVLDEQTEKWNYLGGSVDLEKRVIDFKTSVPGLMIILANQKPQQFGDIKGHWAESDILYMMQRNVVQVSGDQKFYPNRSITRGEFAAFLVKALGLENISQVKKFADVTSAGPYYKEIMAAANSGIVTGASEGKFLPDAQITRQEIAVMMARAIKYSGSQISSTVSVLNQFQDRTKISSWATDSTATVVQAGIMSGRENGIFAPKEFTSKAEAVVLLHRLLIKVGNQ